MTANLTEFATANEGFALISNAKLLALYAAMVACRNKADRTSRNNGHTPIGSAEPVRGFEASVVAATIDLGANDTVAPAIWPNGILKAINSSARQAVALPAAIQTMRQSKNRASVMVFFAGGKRTAQSAWLKSISLATDERLPILFLSLLKTKGPEPTSPLSSGSIQSKSIPTKINACQMPMIDVDGNDVVAVYRVVSESMTHARKGHGPTLIQCHVSNSFDPLENMRKYLIRKGLAEEAL